MVTLVAPPSSWPRLVVNPTVLPRAVTETVLACADTVPLETPPKKPMIALLTLAAPLTELLESATLRCTEAFR